MPEGIHLRCVGCGGRTLDLLAEPLQQRHGQRIGLAAQTRDVSLCHLEPSRHLRAPGDQCGGAPCHQGDPGDRGPAACRKSHQQQGRRPDECVPSGPAAASRCPDQNANDGRRESDGNSRYDPPACFAIRAISPEQSGRGDNERGNRDQQGELPHQPKSDGHAARRRGDSPAQAAD
jgi:hypothetical protein